MNLGSTAKANMNIAKAFRLIAFAVLLVATDPQALDGAKVWMGDKATFRAKSQAEFASFKGIQIFARKDLASDWVELKYQFAFGDGSKRQETKIVEMVKVDDIWRCRQTRAYEAGWDDGSETRAAVLSLTGRFVRMTAA